MKTPWQSFCDDPRGYSRSFLLLVGVFMCSMVVTMAYRGMVLKTEPLYLWTYIALVVTLGVAVAALVAAFSRRPALVETLADGCTTHAAAFVLLLAAWPIQLLLGKFWNRLDRNSIASAAEETMRRTNGSSVFLTRGTPLAEQDARRGSKSAEP